MWVGLVYGNLRAKECIASSSFPCGNLNTVYYSGFIWNYLPASLLDSIFAFPLFFSRLLSFLPTASEGATNQISVQNSAITYLLALPALASFWFCPPYSHGTWDKCMDLHWLMGKHWCAAVAVFSLLRIELCLTPNLGTSCDWIEDARCRLRNQQVLNWVSLPMSGSSAVHSSEHCFSLWRQSSRNPEDWNIQGIPSTSLLLCGFPALDYWEWQWFIF